LLFKHQIPYSNNSEINISFIKSSVLWLRVLILGEGRRKYRYVGIPLDEEFFSMLKIQICVEVMSISNDLDFYNLQKSQIKKFDKFVNFLERQESAENKYTYF